MLLQKGRLAQKVVHLRICIADNKQPQEDILSSVCSFFRDCGELVDWYCDAIRQYYLQATIEKQSPQMQQIFEAKKKGEEQEEEMLVNEKLLLYLWQLLNYCIIHDGKLQKSSYCNILNMLSASIETDPANSPNTIKNAYITLFNLLKRKPSAFSIQTLLLFLTHHFHPTKSLPANRFQSQKRQQHHLAEQEWLGYYLQQLFKSYTGHYKFTDSIVRDAIESAKDKQKAAFQMVHTLGNYLEEMTDRRVTSEMVQGFDCPMKDVRQMYQMHSQNTVRIVLSTQDLEYICQLFQQQQQTQLLEIQHYFRDCSEVNTQRVAKSNEMLLQLSHFLNCLLFLGGYINKLQMFVVERLLLGKGSPLLMYLELMYLLYKQIWHKKHISKIHILSSLQQTLTNKLLQTLSLPSTHPLPAMHPILMEGQISLLLRLLSNLIHINKDGVRPFEENIEYLHIILSLSHECEEQATMREWAVMFIRYATEVSQKVRGEVEKMKIQVKSV